MQPDKSDMDKLDATLQRRAFVPARPGLEMRIIAAARAQARSRGFARLSELLVEIMLPRPALALASVLMLGIVIGAAWPELANPAEDEMLAVYFEEETGFL